MAHSVKRLASAATCVLLASLLFAAGAHAATVPASAAREAVALYSEAQQTDDAERRRALFARAADAFTNLAEANAAAGRNSAEAQANAGTAYLQAGQTGNAVVALRRALTQAPRHERARRTLAELRATLPAWVPRAEAHVDDSFFRWHRNFTLEERSVAMLAAFWVMAIVAATGIAFGMAWLIWLSGLPALVFMGALVSVSMTYWVEDTTYGVITAPETYARTADAANASERFVEPLPAGTEVRIEESREFWTRVRFADGTKAWVRRGAVTAI